MNSEAKLAQSELESWIASLEIEINGMDEIANKLSEHADRLYGSAPTEYAEDMPEFPATGIGHMQRTLQKLRNVNRRVAYEAGRNTTFA